MSCVARARFALGWWPRCRCRAVAACRTEVLECQCQRQCSGLADLMQRQGILSRSTCIERSVSMQRVMRHSVARCCWQCKRTNAGGSSNILRATTLATIHEVTPKAASNMMVNTQQYILRGRVRKHQQRLEGEGPNMPPPTAAALLLLCSWSRGANDPIPASWL